MSENKILQKISRAQENFKPMTIKIEIDGKSVVSHQIDLIQHESDAMSALMEEKNSQLFYVLKDMTGEIRKVLAQKSKKMQWGA